jgi:hypothetical protein
MAASIIQDRLGMVADWDYDALGPTIDLTLSRGPSSLRWAQPLSTPTDVPATSRHGANTTAVASRPLGKQPRIAEYLKEHFPAGVPEPGLYPRKTLRFEILKCDPGLKPLDDATLKKAIEKYNASLTK